MVGKGEKKKPRQEEIPDSRMRLWRVQNELMKVIDKLPSDTHFNIITFNHEIGYFRQGLVPASRTNKMRAIQFVRDFAPEGETYTDEALKAALDIPGVNAIFLLSDGAPRRNDRLLDTEQILDWVDRENRFRRVRINTVAFEQGGRSMKRFMKSLALRNNGKYKGLR